MAEKAGSVPDRVGSLDAGEPGAGTEPASWWSVEPVLATLPPGAREVVRRLERRLFAPGEEAAGAPAGVADDPELETAWRAVEALRAAILEAEERGAPREALRSLHRRLDREAALVARAAVGRCVAESRELLRDVSHDVRSPLNSILFLADTLLSEHSGSLNPVQRRQVGVLYTAAVTLVGLVNDLIDASRFGEGREISVSHVSFSVESVLNDVKSLVGPLATHRGVELAFNLGTVGPRSGDRQLLSRVLINLITNAIQAAEEGGRVEVRVTEPREGWLCAEVRDDGPGEDVEELRRLIHEDAADPYRAGRTRGWTHGLGLAISSRLVRAAGGTISVESQVGKGTRFAVELPFRQVA